MALNIQSKIKLNSGYEIPRLGFGVWQTPADQANEVVTQAFAAGYRHIDSAAAYRNEKGCGAAIHASDLPRSELFFTSKVPTRSLSYDGAKAQVARTLAETGLDYIDLPLSPSRDEPRLLTREKMLLHAPYGGSAARKGAWRALVEAVEAGQVRSIGVSNYGVHHLDELETHIAELEAERGGAGRGGVLSVGQWEIHPWCAREDIAAWCARRGVAVEAYSPLVRGERWGDATLKALAKRHGVSEAQVLVRWSLQKGYIPLPKSATASRIRDNADVYGFELSADEVAELQTEEYAPVCWDPNVAGLEE